MWKSEHDWYYNYDIARDLRLYPQMGSYIVVLLIKVLCELKIIVQVV